MNRNYSPNYRSTAKKSGLRRILPLLGIVGSLCAVLAVLAAAGYYFLTPAEAASRPLVLINAPLNGDQLETGQRVTVRAIARDETNLTRVELWVDGELLEAETSSLPGGISPFPLLVPWQPQAVGNHTLTVRAFNTQGGRAHASINLDVVELPDQDGDGVLDENDACPDEAHPTADGCPDSDGDGVADAEDTCPNETGLPEADGCPSATEGDRDGDGTLDESDSCPDEPGPAPTEGCPDADSDGVADHEDTCPDEAGWVDHDGCPTPGDSDGDGILDEEDACPEERGPAELEGCPDSDGDGLRDLDDACPTEPGPAETEGCPDTDGDGVPDRDDLDPEEPGPPDGGGAPPGPDSDGDGAPDDADLCPDEAGDPEDDYCPPLEADFEPLPDPGDDLFFEIPEFFLGDIQIPVMVEAQALELEVSGVYDTVSCYAGVIGRFYDRYGPFEPLGERRWNIAEYLGEGTYGVPPIPTTLDEPVGVEIDCNATVGVNSVDLGWLWKNHEYPWDGRVLTGESRGGDEGHSFQVKYRICSPSCEESAFSIPYIHTLYNDFSGRPRIAWTWEGDEEQIRGFKIYLNDNFVLTADKEDRAASLPFGFPTCGQGWDIQVSAWDGVDARAPESESPLSNVVTKENEPCPRLARITFLELHTHDIPTDSGFEFCSTGTSVGPLNGGFRASGANTKFLHFRSGYHANWHNYLTGVCVHENRTYDIQSLINECDSLPYEGLGTNSHERSLIHCPASNTVDITLEPGEYWSFGATFTETDRNGTWSLLFDGERVLPSPPENATGGTYTISDERGYMDLIVEVEILPSGP